MTTQRFDRRSTESEGAADEQLHAEFDTEESIDEAEAVLEAEERLATKTSEQLPLIEAVLEIIEDEEAATEAFAAAEVGTDHDAEPDELVGNADVEPDLDEIVRQRTRGDHR